MGPATSTGTVGAFHGPAPTGRVGPAAASQYYSWCYSSSITTVKLSVSLSDADVAVLDEYARASGLRSRSAALQRAIQLLRQDGLEHDYAEAWAEWDASGQAEAWEGTVADGLPDAAR